MASKLFQNRLSKETSLYLLQHAHNPVDWYPWSEEALVKARETNKPLLISIGYSACHWCHVMERESFEDERVASYMNEHFINVKIDREERPDLDLLYMDAVQTMTGSGGWPLNVFLTPTGKPFYGGTYFPPKPAFNRSSWMDVLKGVQNGWNTKRTEIEVQAETLLSHISKLPFQLATAEGGLMAPILTLDESMTIRNVLLSKADKIYGGFGSAPKFPQFFSIQTCLAFGYYHQDQEMLTHAVRSLKALLNGGIYDHLAGGLARYSTDVNWLVPHFEKMLYDNAQLIECLSDAFACTHEREFEEAIHKTVTFLKTEMRHAHGGYFAALDADSEGVEGKFYVWPKDEVETILGDDAAIYCDWYGITAMGNWEHTNILFRSSNLTEIIEKYAIPSTAVYKLIKASDQKLLQARNQRVRPQTDDKIIVSWNALLVIALCKASAATGVQEYKQEAINLFQFIKKSFFENDELVFHTYKNGTATQPAFLDDYATIIKACIQLQEITGEQEYIKLAAALTETAILKFCDLKTGMFYYTGIAQKDIVTRKIEWYDGATASGNSLMLENLFYLSAILDKSAWKEQAWVMAKGLQPVILKYPLSFSNWVHILLKEMHGIHEIALTGSAISEARNELLAWYFPNRVFQSSEKEFDYPLLLGREYKKAQNFYHCVDYTCSAPVLTVNELKSFIKKANN